MHKLFNEFLQVAIGKRNGLYRTPSTEEWSVLFQRSKEQALLGICFAAVKRLKETGDTAQYLPAESYGNWLAVAAYIRMANERVNKKCVALQKKLSEDGFSSCILKGQGVATLYPEELAMLRQSGDIDVWILPQEDEDSDALFLRTMGYVQNIAPTDEFTRKHVELRIFKDTEVEVHFTPAMMNSPRRNRRLQQWLWRKSKDDCQQECVLADSLKIKIPSLPFNLVYLLQHCFDHFLFEGIGLRQVMDYYFVMLHSQDIIHDEYQKEELNRTLNSLGLSKFASAMMWVLGKVFLMEESLMYCQPNEKEGRFLLREIEQGGNFGHYGNDEIMKSHHHKVLFFKNRMKRSLRFLCHYPEEIIWSPYGMVTHYLWKKRHGK